MVYRHRDVGPSGDNESGKFRGNKPEFRGHNTQLPDDMRAAIPSGSADQPVKSPPEAGADRAQQSAMG
jgi:hypothetical protein